MAEAVQQFASEGFAVLPKAAPKDVVETCRAAYYSELLPSTAPFRRVDGRIEAHQLSPEGAMLNGVQGPHVVEKMAAAPRFAQACLELAVDPVLRAAITAATGEEPTFLAQTMVFGASRGPLFHQDSYYIDSIPNGHMAIAIIMLETPDADAGRFCVLPRSHNHDLPSFERADVHDNGAYLPIMLGALARKQDVIFAPHLETGDVLLVGSSNCYGNLGPKYMRKSQIALVAHYILGGRDFGNAWDEMFDPMLHAAWASGIAVNQDC